MSGSKDGGGGERREERGMLGKALRIFQGMRPVP